VLDVAIYEILYDRAQVLSDAAFIEHRVNNYQPEWREFRHVIDFYRSGNYLKHDLVGLFSPKFNLKSKISGAQFIEFCQASGSVDVAFINPFPQVEYIYFNVWEQGECWHPGLMDIANKLLSASGFDLDVKNFKRQTASEILFSNFWVGTPRFWEMYVGGFLNPIAQFLESNVDKELINELNMQTYHSSECGFLPFIVERLFSTYLTLAPNINSIFYPIVNMTPYLIHPHEDKAVQIGRKIIENQFINERVDKRMNILGKVSTELGKQYFKKNKHPHVD
jgi:hypothetical protein